MKLTRRIVPIVDPARCTGCGRCVSACPPRLFSLEAQGWRKISVLADEQDCTGCAKCAVECPVRAISMRKRSVRPALEVISAVAVQPGLGWRGYNSTCSPFEATHAEFTGKPE